MGLGLASEFDGGAGGWMFGNGAGGCNFLHVVKVLIFNGLTSWFAGRY